MKLAIGLHEAVAFIPTSGFLHVVDQRFHRVDQTFGECRAIRRVAPTSTASWSWNISTRSAAETATTLNPRLGWKRINPELFQLQQGFTYWSARHPHLGGHFGDGIDSVGHRTPVDDVGPKKR